MKEMFHFIFSIAVYIQYYFVLASGIWHNGRQSYTLQSDHSNISITHLASTGYYAEWHNSEIERQMPYDFTCTWNQRVILKAAYKMTAMV